jgi:nitrate/nitrite transport system substrate-binding protein
LNTNGQAISVSNDFKDAKLGVKSSGLKESFAAKSAGKEPKCAVTFPGGTHDLWMRYWLAANGINPETDVSIIVVPPPQMVANMKTNSMLAFCVGEPWNAQLVSQKLGSTALVTGELWKDHPEKALAMRADWVEKHPNAARAITAAVIEAQQWCEKMENKDEMCKIIGERKWLKVEPTDIVERAKGNVEYGDGKPALSASDLKMKFWADNASFPYKSHDIWFMTENIRWGKIPADTDVKALVDKVNRSDIWREAAKVAGVAAGEIPTGDSRGVEKFFDGVEFDSENPKKYLDALKIKKA